MLEGIRRSIANLQKGLLDEIHKCEARKERSVQVNFRQRIFHQTQKLAGFPGWIEDCVNEEVTVDIEDGDGN